MEPILSAGQRKDETVNTQKTKFQLQYKSNALKITSENASSISEKTPYNR